MTSFARYAFNKSHAACYAVVAYETAYLKAHYPKEYMAALLTSVMDSIDKVGQYILACKKMGIKLLPPDVNKGYSYFSVDDEGIRYGMGAIKNLGVGIIDVMVDQREAGGKFVDLKDFITRMTKKDFHRKACEILIKSGALDSLDGTRKQKLAVYNIIIDNIISDRKNNMEGQMSLFDFGDALKDNKDRFAFPNIGEYSKEELLELEKEVLGIYVSGHPLDEYSDLLEKNVTNFSVDLELDEENHVPKLEDGQNVILGGIVTAKSIKTTKKGEQMAFVSLEDQLGTAEIIVFPRVYELFSRHLDKDAKILVYGRINSSDMDKCRVICDKIIGFENVPKEVWFKLSDKDEYESLKELFDKFTPGKIGKDDVVIYIASERKKKVINNLHISMDDTLILDLTDELGKENVAVRYKKRY